MEGHHILVLTDNIAAKAHVNRQGGMRSRALMFETEWLFNWVERHLKLLKADHILGTANVRADWLSREQIDPAEWQLHPPVFREIVSRFGTPWVDLFASPANTKLPCFVSRYLTPLAEDHDALRCRWPSSLLYAFPPIPLVPHVIRKLLSEKADLLLVAPNWLRRPWYADLVALSVDRPWVIPPHQVSLCQGAICHPGPRWLQLAGI